MKKDELKKLLLTILFTITISNLFENISWLFRALIFFVKAYFTGADGLS